jgi:hypothetical protein
MTLSDRQTVAVPPVGSSTEPLAHCSRKFECPSVSMMIKSQITQLPRACHLRLQLLPALAFRTNLDSGITVDACWRKRRINYTNMIAASAANAPGYHFNCRFKGTV